jgi:hypothetical protein
MSQVWWYTPVIPAFRRLRQKDCNFKPTWVTQQVPGQPGLYSEILSQKNKTNKQILK